MAINTSWFALDTAIGINFNQTYAATVAVATSVATSTALIDQGTAVVATDSVGVTRKGTLNTEWILVKASTTITQYNVMCFDDNFNANNFTTQLALSGNGIALAEFSTYNGQVTTVADPAVNPVFWAAIRGSQMGVNVSGSAGTGVALNNGTVPGSISVSATGSHIAGLALYASAGASGVVECLINYPRLGSL